MSRLASSRGSSTPAAFLEGSDPRGAPPPRRSGSVAQKRYLRRPCWVSPLGAIVISCILMLILWGRYDFKTKVSARTPAARSTALG